MNFSGEFFKKLSDEDKVIVARIGDMADIAEKKHQPKFSFFLDDMQISLAVSAANHIGVSYILWGGYEDASRNIIGIFPEFYPMDNVNEEFPIQALCFRYKPEYKLSHRDFLGSFMSKRIDRSLVGDIIVNDGCTVAFVYKTAVEIISSECVKIGSVGVKITALDNPEIIKNDNFSEIKGTVSSLRLDCIVSLCTRLSREKSAMLIKCGSVSIRYRNVKHNDYQFIPLSNELQPSALLDEGDTFSIRGYGKFILDSVGNKTKKDRLFICVKKYT